MGGRIRLLTSLRTPDKSLGHRFGERANWKSSARTASSVAPCRRQVHDRWWPDGCFATFFFGCQRNFCGKWAQKDKITK
jgi:hypothetical protein